MPSHFWRVSCTTIDPSPKPLGAGTNKTICFLRPPTDRLSVETSGRRERLLAKDPFDGGAVFVDLFGLAHELVDGGRIGKGALGVEPPLLHAKDCIAANLFCIGRKQCVVEAMQFGCSCSRTALYSLGTHLNE